jgi:hypothetical protein
MSRLWIRRAVAAVFAVAATAALTPATAGADPWLPTPAPDNRLITYCWASAFNDNGDLKAAATYALQNLENQTSYTSQSHFTNCTANTDIVFRITREAGLRGAYRCVTRNAEGRCQQANIWMNPANLANTLNRRKTACHEVGHYGRLVHHDPPYSDCMVSGHISSGHQQYNAHHVWHLNQPLP